MLFSIEAVPIHIPTNRARGVPSFQTLSITCFRIFNDRYSDQCEVISNCGVFSFNFWLHWVFVSLQGFSLVVESEGYFLFWVCCAVIALVAEHRI